MFPATTWSRCLVLRQSWKHLRELYFCRDSTDYQYINGGGRLFSYHNQAVLTLSHRGWTILPKRYFTSDIPKNEKDVTSIDMTIGGLKRRWGKCLEEEGVPESDLSVEAIVAHVLGKKMFHELDASIMTLLPTKKEKEDIDRLCHQRLKRMPVQYIINEWDFRDMTLIMKPPVFIPGQKLSAVTYRSKIFVEIITDHYRKDEELKILEIGCGSGAISVSLLRAFNKSRVTAFDVLEEAVELTQENAARLDFCDLESKSHNDEQLMSKVLYGLMELPYK
ncbi:hypothetical protein BSL78_05108 [Apostichopus japonicus]|uniref:HemK methyltransferase family member 1 n=1 Tax=Stichopus japonicus TaxID=307972 RepID=A0A2G8LCJ1_STIJA|nr:hypothetical protein BSL78_05108 [Apostichopus japonicus]